MAKVIPFGTLPNAEKLDYYLELGIEEVVLSLPSAGADRVLPFSTSTRPICADRASAIRTVCWVLP